jgi:hypothetical protein
MIDSTLDLIRIAEVRILIDITELEGWEPSAAWEEFRLDLRHGRRFDRIAIYGSRGWENSGASIAGWFLTGEVKHFADIDTALRWLSG